MRESAGRWRTRTRRPSPVAPQTLRRVRIITIFEPLWHAPGRPRPGSGLAPPPPAPRRGPVGTHPAPRQARVSALRAVCAAAETSRQCTNPHCHKCRHRQPSRRQPRGAARRQLLGRRRLAAWRARDRERLGTVSVRRTPACCLIALPRPPALPRPLGAAARWGPGTRRRCSPVHRQMRPRPRDTRLGSIRTGASFPWETALAPRQAERTETCEQEHQSGPGVARPPWPRRAVYIHTSRLRKEKARARRCARAR